MSEKLAHWLIWFSGGAVSMALIIAALVFSFLVSVWAISFIGTRLDVPQPTGWDTLSWLFGTAFGVGATWAIALKVGVFST